MDYEKIDGIPFREKLTARLQTDYPELYERRKDELGDPFMQTALWTIMEAADAKKRALQSHQYERPLPREDNAS